MFDSIQEITCTGCVSKKCGITDKETIILTSEEYKAQNEKGTLRVMVG